MRKLTSNAVLLQDNWQSNQRRFTKSHTHIFDINYDSLRKLFQYLDISSQFSMLQAHPLFVDAILFDMWYQHYETSFDITKDQSIFQRPPTFQCDFLQKVLSRFPRITGVPSDIFKNCVKLTKHSTFKNVLELEVCNYNKTETILDFSDFSKFTHLKTLKIENVSINFKNGHRLKPVENLSLVASFIFSDDEGEFSQNIFSGNLKTLDLRPLSMQYLSAEQFSNIANCINLENLTVFSHLVQRSKCLNAVLNLPNLKKLTIFSFNNFHFSPRDHNVFRDIFEKFSHDREKRIVALEMYGIPEKRFFHNSHMKGVRVVKWAIDKVFHKKSNGCVEWSSYLGDTIHAFCKFIAASRSLKILDVCNNIVHRKRHLEDPNFENDLQLQRQRLGYDAIQIIGKDNVQREAILSEQSNGFVTFYLQRNSDV